MSVWTVHTKRTVQICRTKTNRIKFIGKEAPLSDMVIASLLFFPPHWKMKMKM